MSLEPGGRGQEAESTFHGQWEGSLPLSGSSSLVNQQSHPLRASSGTGQNCPEPEERPQEFSKRELKHHWAREFSHFGWGEAEVMLDLAKFQTGASLFPNVDPGRPVSSSP